LKGLPTSGRPIGESWEFSVHADHPGRAILADGKEVELTSVFAGRSAGLLIKFVDARDNLSLQVHPSDAYARRHENSSGKSESWFVLGVGNNAGDGYIYLGFDDQKRRAYKTIPEFSAAFARACRGGEEKEILSFVRKIKVKPGDAFHVPPGTVHAVGRGVIFFEIQQSSGLTYRLWDWNRRGRDMHLDKAFDVLDFSSTPPPVEDSRRLADPMGNYEAEVISVASTLDVPAGETFCVLTVLDGEMDLAPGPKKIRAGQSVLIPEKIGVTVKSAGKNAVRVVFSRPKGPRPSSGSR
jgi:mannose-6-phosphate isomerase class I